MAKTATTYELRFTITVDRPELRGSSYGKVAPGTKVPTTWTYNTIHGAKNELEEIASGRMDFSSEYISSYQLTQVCANGRKRTLCAFSTRSRNETETQRMIAQIARRAVTRGALHMARFSAAPVAPVSESWLAA